MLGDHRRELRTIVLSTMGWRGDDSHARGGTQHGVGGDASRRALRNYRITNRNDQTAKLIKR